MTANKIVFDDGSSIEWADRESLKYADQGYVALIWVDYEPGFFSRGRVLMMKSLNLWHEAPLGYPLEISNEKKEEIVEKVRNYYGSKPLRISNQD